MWSLQCWFAIWAFGSRNPARLDRRKAKHAVYVRGYPAEAAELFFDWLILDIFGMRILAVGIGLPDFDYAIRNGLRIAIQYSPADVDPFAGRAGRGKVVAIKPR